MDSSLKLANLRSQTAAFDRNATEDIAGTCLDEEEGSNREADPAAPIMLAVTVMSTQQVADRALRAQLLAQEYTTITMAGLPITSVVIAINGWGN